MSDPGLDEVFSALDLSVKGYLTTEQIQKFDESLHYSLLCSPQVDAAITDVCGSSSNGLVQKQQFVPVLQELKRRRDLEDRLHWDFMALDSTGNNRITIPDALLLFQITQGQQFSMYTWNEFLNSRPHPAADVYFDEVRLCLCNKPGGEPSGDGEKYSEMDRLRKVKEEENENEFTKIQNYQVDEYTKTKSTEDYHNQTKRLARKKQYLWEKDGVEALLYDDGQDHGEDIPTRARANLSITDIIDALHHKYNIIRKKLLYGMLQKQYGDSWYSMSEDEQYGSFEQLQLEEKQLRQEGQLATKSAELPGAKTHQDAPLEVLMGDHPQDLKTSQAFLKQRILKMQDDGKLAKDIEITLREEFKRAFRDESSPRVLVSLSERFQYERDYYLEKLHSDDVHQVSPKELSHAYVCLLRQHLMAENIQSYLPAAVAVGLAERIQGSDICGVDTDCQRQELLAKERLLEQMDKTFTPTTPEVTKSKQASLSDIQLAVVKETTMKQQTEQQVLIEMLQGQESTTFKASAKKSNYDRRQNRLISLRNARNNWRENITEDNKGQHWKLLQEAVGLHWVGQFEEHASKGYSTAEIDVNARILAALQQTQDKEFSNLIAGLFQKSEKEVTVLLKVQQQARVNQLYDNIAAIVLGTYTWSDDEKPLVDAIDNKYDVMRQLCLRHSLRMEYGLGWLRLSESDKDKLLIKKRVEEKKLRQEGKVRELDELIKLLPEDIGMIRGLLGEDRDEYNKRVIIQEQRINAMIERGEKVQRKLLNFDEIKDSKEKCMNLLADLLPRQHAEQDALIGWLRSHDSESGDMTHLLPLVLVRTEKWLAKRGEQFDIGALAVGLLERVSATLDGRHATDVDRQRQLAVCRVRYRQTRIQTGEPYYREVDTIRPQKGDIQAWMEVLLKEVLKKHADEREMFLNLMQDSSMEELHDAARLMTQEEQTNRLRVLYQKKQKLDLDKSDDREENISILEEAAAIRTVNLKAQLKTNQSDHSMETVSIQLLRELQEAQDVETAKLIKRLPNMNEAELRVNREHEISCRHQGSGEHAIMILTSMAGNAEENELIEALEEKYEVMVDKLLLEALIRQVGEADWLRMSELDRQRRLLELKIQARKLKKQGDEDGLARLLNQREEDDELLCKLMGDNRAEFERKLQEKLARRKKGSSDDVDLEEDDEASVKPVNPLSALDDRFNQEKDALLAQLRGSNEKILTERERQMALIRLKREKRKAEQEGSFHEMAMMMGLAERQQCDLIDRLKNDRMHQEEIARKKIEALRKKKAQSVGKLQKIPEVITEGHLTSLQDIVMQRLDEKHKQECNLLVHFLSKSPSKDNRKRLEASTEYERQEMRNDLHNTWKNTQSDHVEASVTLLQEACYAKTESQRQHLMETPGSGKVTQHDIDVSLMADLQDSQDAEAESYLQTMKVMVEAEIIALQEKILAETHYQRGQCLVSLLFGAENQGKQGEREVIDALQAKYDALRDKLLLESLEKKFGEKAWQKMSNEERNRHLKELKLQERKLREEGRLEEADALLGETLRNHDTLDDLVGENRAEYEKTLQERLEKRKLRLSQGLTEEECDKLEAEEAKEHRQKKKNILQNIDDNFEKERDALLNALNQQKDSVVAEKERQLQLARLRRDQRKAAQENDYEAAALAIDLGKEHLQACEQNRIKQEQLARERLASKLKLRHDKTKPTEAVEKEVDVNDSMSLIASISEKVDIKHANERDVLIQFFRDVSLVDRVRVASGHDEEERRERTGELRELRDSWRHLECAEPDDQIKLLKEGLCLRLVQLQHHSEADGRISSLGDLQVALLADLQEIQDKETQKLVHEVDNQTPYVLRHLRMSQMFAIKKQWHDNLVSVILSAEVDTSGETALVQALKDKYDVVRDKLFTEVLIQNMGAKKWDNLSREEQQKLVLDLKLQHKHLQRAGKLEEAAALLTGLADRGAELQDKLGVSYGDESQRSAERQKQREKLIEEREENGLTVDEAVLDAILGLEHHQTPGKTSRKRNILEELDHHFEDEKAALLKQLKDQESQLETERLRQLEILRLRRQQKQLQTENKLESAAILLNLAEQHEAARKESVNQEMKRQRTLAKERLDAMRKRRLKITGQSELEKQLKDEGQELERHQATVLVNQQQQGDMVLKEAVLLTIERKHRKERDLLEQLISISKDDSAITDSTRRAKNLGKEDIIDQLEQLEKDWNSWISHSRQLALQLTEKGDQPSAQDTDQHVKDMAQNHIDAFHLLTQALFLKIEVEKHRMREIGQTVPDIENEVLVTLIGDLHQKQEAESRATEHLVIDQPADVLQKLNDTQQMAAQEGWYNNLASVLFTITASLGLPELDEKSKQKHEADRFLLLDKLQNEFDQERLLLQEKLEKEVEDGAEINIEEELNKLVAQQEIRKQAIEDSSTDRVKNARLELETSQYVSDNLAYEKEMEEVLMSLINEDQVNDTTEITPQTENMLQQKLSERRERRHRDKMASRRTSSSSSSSGVRSRIDHTPDMTISRERTVIDVSLTDDQKNELYEQLMQQQSALNKKLETEHKRHEEQLKERLERMKEKRSTEAADLMKMAERQKTTLEKLKHGEHERQIAATKERVARLRYEKTQTMRELGNENSRKFGEYLNDKELSGMSADEKMQAVAKKMEDQFKEEESKSDGVKLEKN